jgi:hypothetical protein
LKSFNYFRRHLVHTLNVNCPHCGEMHAVSVRETYIDDAIRNLSEIARRVRGPSRVVGTETASR